MYPYKFMFPTIYGGDSSKNRSKHKIIPQSKTSFFST